AVWNANQDAKLAGASSLQRSSSWIRSSSIARNSVLPRASSAATQPAPCESTRRTVGSRLRSLSVSIGRSGPRTGLPASVSCSPIASGGSATLEGGEVGARRGVVAGGGEEGAFEGSQRVVQVRRSPGASLKESVGATVSASLGR